MPHGLRDVQHCVAVKGGRIVFRCYMGNKVQQWTSQRVVREGVWYVSSCTRATNSSVLVVTPC